MAESLRDISAYRNEADKSAGAEFPLVECTRSARLHDKNGRVCGNCANHMKANSHPSVMHVMPLKFVRVLLRNGPMEWP